MAALATAADSTNVENSGGSQSDASASVPAKASAVGEAGEEADAPETDPNYRVAAKASVNEIMSKDADDVELAKYKARLLGLPDPGSAAGSSALGGSDKASGRHVTVLELRLHFEGRDSPLVISLGNEGGENAADPNIVYILKEGQEYRMELIFRVEDEIVLGLKFLRSVYRRGIRVDKEQVMVGSYPPKSELVTFKFPIDTVPSGMLARGKYQARIQMVDDDGTLHHKCSYYFKIAKNWS